MSELIRPQPLSIHDEIYLILNVTNQTVGMKLPLADMFLVYFLTFVMQS